MPRKSKPERSETCTYTFTPDGTATPPRPAPSPALPASCAQQLRNSGERGPAAHGWADQRWTLARVTTLIGRLFHLRYTPRGTAYLLHRMGWSPQVPRHRAAERDEDAIAAWRTLTWAKVRG